jgi:hypothetical protein
MLNAGYYHQGGVEVLGRKKACRLLRHSWDVISVDSVFLVNNRFWAHTKESLPMLARVTHMYEGCSESNVPHFFFLGNYLLSMCAIPAQYNWMFPLHM